MYAPLAHERLHICIQCFILVWHSSVDGNVNLMVWRLVHHFSLVDGFMYIMWWFWEQYTADSGVCDAVRLIEPWTWSNLVKKKKKKKIGLFFFFLIKGSAPSAGSSPLQLLLPCGEPRTRHTHTPISLWQLLREPAYVTAMSFQLPLSPHFDMDVFVWKCWLSGTLPQVLG